MKANEDPRQELDDIRAITTVLRNFCEGKNTLKEAMPTLVWRTSIPKERIELLLKKHFKDKYE